MHVSTCTSACKGILEYTSVYVLTLDLGMHCDFWRLRLMQMCMQGMDTSHGKAVHHTCAVVVKLRR
jgi:hypothetical protein